MGRLEISELKDLRTKLRKKVNDLTSKLEEQDASGSGSSRVFNLVHIDTRENNTSLEQELLGRNEHELCQLSSHASGITFENVDKIWLRDNFYRYTTYLISKAITFIVELTVSTKGKEEFEIANITGHFANIGECYLLEFEIFIKEIMRQKNFSLLTSVVSQYSEESIVRSEVLHDLEVKKYGRIEECTDGNGGVLIHIRLPKDPTAVIIKFQWSLLFMERTNSFQHVFIISPTETGIKFAEDHESLLRGFHNVNIEKTELIDLWTKLCDAVDHHEAVC